jgi:hypothetical protein
VTGAALPRILVAADQATHLLVRQALKDEFDVVPAGAGLDAVEKAVVGGADYITQPIHASIIKARVRTHIELARLRGRLEQLSFVDPLTGIANRARSE